MVSGSRWTGYFTEIDNLVPACGKCNQSRGSKPVAVWMRSRAPWSPLLVLQVRDGLDEAAAMAEVDRRIAIIEAAIVAAPPTKLDLIDDPLEAELETCRIEVNVLLHKAEQIAAKLRARYQALAAG